MYKNILLSSTLITTSLLANQNMVPLGNINGNTGIILKKNNLMLAITHDTCSKDKAYNGSAEVIDIKNRRMSSKISKFKVRYGISNKIDIRAIITRKDKELEIGGKTYSNKGMGDSLLVARYEIFNQRKNDNLFLSIGAGMKLSTGDTSKIFTKPNKLQIMQLGSGSNDYIAEAGLTKILKNSRIDFNTMYTKTTKGDNNYQFGDKLKWNLGYSYALTNKFSIQMELDGCNIKKHRLYNKDVDSTGGNFTYLTPAIHYKINKNYNMSVGYAHMIYRDVNYDSTNKIGGLSEDGRFMLRFVMSI